jgi:hypothetical protein
VKGRSSPDLASIRPVPLLALGFAISALATYATAFVLGGAVLGGVRAGAIAKWAAAGALAIFIAVDAGALGLHTPMWRRQTPRGLFLQYGAAKGAFLWGLDSGLVVTTFRVTSLSWAALTVTLLGLVPWWSGLAYALGFAVPTAMLVLAGSAGPRMAVGEDR